MKITVVIPYFQREPGILKRALSSVLEQRGVAAPTVIVVDDESPAPPEQELSALPQELRKNVVVIRQPNGGPASARNFGLESLPQDTDAVAFLDSDDIWHPDHLANACVALRHGFDFYYADYFPLGGKESVFRATKMDYERHRQLEPGRPVYAFSGDWIIDSFCVRGVGTSTVVYRLAPNRHLRFPTHLRFAGEDLIFWLSLFLNVRCVAFSSTIECTYGRGVNIYGNSKWGSETYLHTLVDQICCYAQIMRMPLTSAQQVPIQAVRSRLRRPWVTLLLHRLAHRQAISIRTLHRSLAADPWLAISILVESARVVAQRFRQPA